MEPIDPFAPAGFLQNSRDKKKVDRKAARKLAFSSVFTAAKRDASPGTSLGDLAEENGLEYLLDRVHESGQKVKDNATLALVQDYKEAVRGFVAYVVRHALRIEETESGASVLKRKRFTLLKVIDRRLEKFAADILSGQREQLDIARRVDEINGLLVDLMS